MIVDEAGMGQDAMGWIPFLHRLDDETDEAVTLFAHPPHHFPALDSYPPVDVYTEAGGPFDPAGRFGRGDQQLGRHAPHAGASGAILTAFDQGQTVRMFPRSAISAHAGRSRTDDRHIYSSLNHGGLQSCDDGDPCDADQQPASSR